MDTSTTIYDIVMAHLKSKRIPQRAVANGSGVPFSTVTKIAQGQIKAPNVHHVQALYDYFIEQNKEVGDVGGSLTAAKNATGDGKKYITTREFKDFDVQVEEAMAVLAALRERVREEHEEAKEAGLVR